MKITRDLTPPTFNKKQLEQSMNQAFNQSDRHEFQKHLEDLITNK